MNIIAAVKGREIYDSRGNPTVSVEVTLSSGIHACAAVPSGASTGEHEALELRDGGKRLNGKGVRQAVKLVNTDLQACIKGMPANIVEDLQAIDAAMIAADGSDNKGHIGANSILGVSMAVARVAAEAKQIPLYEWLNADAYLLPVPCMNVINGGEHADNNLDLQEFMIVPAGASTFADSLAMGAEVFHALSSVLSKNGYNGSLVGDEGGYAPSLPSHAAAIDFILQAIDMTGLKAGTDISLAMDCAASEFYKDGHYHLAGENKVLDSEGMIDFLADWLRQYPIISIEDGLDENDWDGWKKMTEKLGDKVQLVGDDLFVTNPKILQRGIDNNIANALLVKPNQIGSLTETHAAVDMAMQAGYRCMMSHRSGETEDTTIADLSVAWATGQIKSGSASRSERMAKYNRLMLIEEMLGSRAKFAGFAAFGQS
ncbi:MAG: phosphopyruvate hydratase [Mariprofundales bacterium]